MKIGQGIRYKFFWKGRDAGESGVGIFVAEKYVEKVVSVERLSDRLIVLRVIMARNSTEYSLGLCSADR